MKLKELVDARGVIPMGNTAAPLKTKYKLAKFLSQTGEDFAFYTAEYRKIIDETADKTESGVVDANGMIHIPADKIEEYNRRVTELNEMKVATPDVSFTTDELEPLALSIESVAKLFPFIKEDE